MIKDHKIFLQHISDAIARIETYTKGIPKDKFLRNKKYKTRLSDALR